MAHRVYFRASTEGQDFIQQQKCVLDYLTRCNIEVDDTTTEKISGTVSHTERKLCDLLERCEVGDVVYVSELSRLGRCMSDLFAIVSEATTKGVKLVQCKDGSTIESESIGGKALLFALSLAAEIEVANIRQRTQMALDARKEMIRKNGGFVSKAGNWCTKLGREKGADTSAANIASCKAKTDAAMEWREGSSAYKLAIKRNAQGVPRARILEELGELWEIDPKAWGTRQGCRVSKGVLSKWLSGDATYVEDMTQSERRSAGITFKEVELW